MRSHRYGVILVASILLSAPASGAFDTERDLRERAARLHRDAVVVDGHNDVTTFILDYGFDLGMDGGGAAKRDATLYWLRNLRWLLPAVGPEDLRMDTDLRRLREGGVDAQFFSIFADPEFVVSDPSEGPGAKQRALDMINALDLQLRRHSQDLELARTTADVRRIVSQGKIAALMGLEGGHAIEDDLANLRLFATLGVRYMTLTWENANGWADSCYDEPHGGLTEFGRAVVREMNRLGVMIDVSHVSDATFFDVLEVTGAPVIASHSSARALVDHPRNMSDEMLRALAANGGVVMINFSEFFTDPDKAPPWGPLLHVASHFGWEETPLSKVIDHIDHAVRVAGVDHVGLGSDFAGTYFTPQGLKDVSGFPNITAELLRRGYSDADVRRILGENLLRVMSDVELAARR
jgi:membrane dipeptidase